MFRKGDSPSCLVVDKTWDQILNKPVDFDELAKRLLDMYDAAEIAGILRRPDTLRRLKQVVMDVLLTPLREPVESGSSSGTPTKGAVLADAFWDEIVSTTEVDMTKLKEALARAYNMKIQIEEHEPPKSKDTLMDVKTNFNDTILKPLLGINEDE